MSKCVKDFKEDGLWVKARHDASGPLFTRTRASRYWNGIRTRCKKGGLHQQREPTYLGCEMSDNFKDFQYFAEWCQGQIGYDLDWHLDKDIILKGNKFYSEDLCVFVPREINNCFTKGKARRGKYPLGVNLHAETGRYLSRCHTNSGESKYLGLFDDVNLAFQAYKQCKENYIKQLAEQYRDKVDPRVYNALMNYKVEITD